MADQPNEDAVQPRINRGRVGSLSLYEITDHELQVLEEGSLGTTFLNFAVFFLSVALSFLATLLVTPIESDRVFTVFVVFVIVGFAAGGVLLKLWSRARRNTSKVLKRIKDRCLPEGAPRTVVQAVSGAGESESEAG